MLSLLRSRDVRTLKLAATLLGDKEFVYWAWLQGDSAKLLGLPWSGLQQGKSRIGWDLDMIRVGIYHPFADGQGEKPAVTYFTQLKKECNED